MFYWDMIDMWHYITLKYTTYWFDVCMYCKMITTISSVNIYHHHSYKFFLMMRTFKIYSLRSFQKLQCRIVNYNHDDIHYIPRTYLITGSLPFDHLYSFSLFPSLDLWQPPFCSLFLWVPFFFLDSTYKWDHTVFVFLCLTYFT